MSDALTIHDILIKDLPKHEAKTVRIKGWLYNRRHKGKLAFLVVRDGSQMCQATVFKGDVTEEVFELCAQKLTQESSVIVEGVVRADQRAPLGFEISVKNVVAVQIAQEYPIQPKEHGVDFLMNKRHLWLRSSKQWAMMQIRNEFLKATRDFFYDNDFTCIDAPIFTPSACEGTTNLFEVTYFEDKAYLSQSGQLYMEAAAMAMGKVYCLGPTFRSEKSKTRRHLTEFWMIEPEVAYATLDDIMVLAENYVSYAVGRVVEKCRPHLEILERDITKLENIKAPFYRLSYDDAVKFLKDKGMPFEYGNDLGAPDETAISENYDRPVFIHRYPTACKAFYMAPDPEKPHLALCADLIAPEGYGEIIGGSQRADDIDYLLKKIAEHKLPAEIFDWYLDLRKYGSVPHSGFGLGIERTLSWICKVPHVRECIPFPRLMERIYP
ncbi:MAG TPA: asparagine--tRNA ligase [Candidatus Wallbacteria bacterium]|mgnify:FL=1|nr:MAG: Asparagine--tRNA ligase [bacterium ADurb.Bin243]HPG58911.1 asparagine--tRNA ligase [Candidatus Wallbacteria bacterium]